MPKGPAARLGACFTAEYSEPTAVTFEKTLLLLLRTVFVCVVGLGAEIWLKNENPIAVTSCALDSKREFVSCRPDRESRETSVSAAPKETAVKPDAIALKLDVATILSKKKLRSVKLLIFEIACSKVTMEMLNVLEGRAR